MESDSKICAIIPARGGSRGIPRKNIVQVNGKPLIAYSIEHALNSERIDRVIVSTDDPEISEVAKGFGAEVPFERPAELAQDHVLDWPVFAHALAWLRSHEGYEPSVIVHLRPTAPIRLPGQIDEAISLLISSPAADSVRSVSIPNQHPYRMFSIAKSGFLQPLLDTPHDEPYLLRRQDLPSVYWYNCVIDVTRTTTIYGQKSMTGKRITPYIIDGKWVVDIDSEEDLILAESKMRFYSHQF